MYGCGTFWFPLQVKTPRQPPGETGRKEEKNESCSHHLFSEKATVTYSLTAGYLNTPCVVAMAVPFDEVWAARLNALADRIAPCLIFFLCAGRL